MHSALITDKTCWKFNKFYLQFLLQQFNLPPIQLDCFASSNNTLCSTYCSKYKDGTKFVADFFTNIPLIKEKFNFIWANPPFLDLILNQTINNFCQYNLKGIVLVPLWPNQSFWTHIQHYTAQFIIPPHKDLFSSVVSNYRTFQNPPSFNISLLLFNHSILPHKHYIFNHNQKTFVPLTLHHLTKCLQLSYLLSGQQKLYHRTIQQAFLSTNVQPTLRNPSSKTTFEIIESWRIIIKPNKRLISVAKPLFPKLIDKIITDSLFLQYVHSW